jgi:RNA polymerase sigma-70 factor (ECF subfamily)
MSRELGKIFDAHAPALYAFLLNLTRDEPDARDILQEVFVKLAARPALLDGVAEVRSWLFRTGHRQAMDAGRRRATRERLVERVAQSIELFAPAHDPDADSFREAVAKAMAELPEEQRAVVHLKIWEGLTLAQIADILGIPANTAASRYRYGIDKLEGLLRPLHDERS